MLLDNVRVEVRDSEELVAVFRIGPAGWESVQEDDTAERLAGGQGDEPLVAALTTVSWVLQNYWKDQGETSNGTGKAAAGAGRKG